MRETENPPVKTARRRCRYRQTKTLEDLVCLTARQKSRYVVGREEGESEEKERKRKKSSLPNAATNSRFFSLSVIEIDGKETDS